jgi:hypothetical protein
MLEEFLMSAASDAGSDMHIILPLLSTGWLKNNREYDD